MRITDFRAIAFPYCLQRQSNGRWVVLNRRYKPIGFNTSDWINYGDHPVETNIAITSDVIEKLGGFDSPDKDRVYLYGDGTNPVRSKVNMDLYLEKLRILAALEVNDASPTPSEAA